MLEVQGIQLQLQITRDILYPRNLRYCIYQYIINTTDGAVRVIIVSSLGLAGVFSSPACLIRRPTNEKSLDNGLFLSLAEYHMISWYSIFMIPYEPWSPRIPHNINS